MTQIRHKGKIYEWTYMLDTYNNKIIASDMSSTQGNRKPYFNCLDFLKKKMKEQNDPLVLHTDQGSVYSSRAFSEAHKNYNITQSMSRAGTPTDNPIIESINGWIKCEMKTDFNYHERDNIYEFVDYFIEYFNNERPAYALDHKSPVQYRIERGYDNF